MAKVRRQQKAKRVLHACKRIAEILKLLEHEFDDLCNAVGADAEINNF